MKSIFTLIVLFLTITVSGSTVQFSVDKKNVTTDISMVFYSGMDTAHPVYRHSFGTKTIADDGYLELDITALLYDLRSEGLEDIFYEIHTNEGRIAGRGPFEFSLSSERPTSLRRVSSPSETGETTDDLVVGLELGLSGEDVNFIGDNFGIHTDTPDGDLDVTSTTTPQVYIQTSAASSQDAALHIRGARTTSTTSDIAQLHFEDNANGDLASITARKQTASTNQGNLLFWTTTTDGGTPTEKMRLDRDGNLGIGTSTPSEKLDVVGNAVLGTTSPEPHLSFKRAGYNYIWAPASGTIAFLTNGRTAGESTSNLVLQNDQNSHFNGYLGIGTDVPGYDLHVVGDQYLTGNIGIGTTPTGSYNINVYENTDGNTMLHLRDDDSGVSTSFGRNFIRQRGSNLDITTWEGSISFGTTSSETERMRINNGGSVDFFTTIDMNSYRINNLTDPAAAQDAATKAYVDAAAASAGDNLGDHTATTDIDMSNNDINNIYSLEFENTEYEYHPLVSGRLFFDENFYPAGEPGEGSFIDNGGGLSIYNEDGWGAIVTDENMEYLSMDLHSLHVGGTSNPGADNAVIDGTLGVGTTTPAGKVHIEHTGTIGTTSYNMGNAWLRVGDLGFDPNEVTTTGDLYITGQNFVRLGSGSNNSIVHVDPSGNVGIGTTSPASDLSVGGTGSALYKTYSYQATTSTSGAAGIYGGAAQPSVDLAGHYAYGVHGHTASGNGHSVGVYGSASGGTGAAGRSMGVRGYATGSTAGYNHGVVGEIPSGTFGSALVGVDRNEGTWGGSSGSGSSYAGYFYGDVNVTGDLNVSGNITGSVTDNWVNESGDIMTGNLNMGDNMLVIDGTSPRISGRGLELYGSTSSALLATQDGNGRIQLKWNATHGTGETYLASSEPAFFWDMTISSDPIWEMKYAGSGTAGAAIPWNTLVALESNGDFGIGTNAPEDRLEVSGGGITVSDGTDQGFIDFRTDRNDSRIYEKPYALYSQSANGLGFEIDPNNNDGGFFNVTDRGVSRLYINDVSGNVGLGTTGPSQTLDVNGRTATNGMTNDGDFDQNGTADFSTTVDIHGTLDMNDNRIYRTNYVDISDGDDNGIRFWNGSTNYTFTMGDDQQDYGWVTDYSMHMNMGTTDNRGFTWGYSDVNVVASLEAETGHFRTRGVLYAENYVNTNNDYRMDGSTIINSSGQLAGNLLAYCDARYAGSGGDGDWTIGSGVIYNTSDEVAVGTSTSDGYGLNVQHYTSGKAAIRGTDESTYIYAEGQLGVLSWTDGPLDVTNIGVLGIKPNQGGNGVAVYAWNNDDNSTNYGMYTNSNGAGTTNYGIYAAASGASTNWAGYFNGNVNITGNLSVSGTVPGDNLGNHIATTNLNVNSHDIYISSGRSIGVAGDNNIIFDDGNPTWYSQSYGGIIKIYGDNGSDRGKLEVGGIEVYNDIEVEEQIYFVDVNTYLQEGASNSVRVGTNSGYMDIGPKNTGWCHFSTDRPRYYFDKGITVDQGLIGSYDENLSLQTSGTTRMTLNTSGNVGIATTTPDNRLDVNGKISVTQSAGDEMVIINDDLWTHGSGSKDFGDGGDHFLMASRESSYESAGIYGDGDHLTLWSPGDGAPGQSSALLYILDEDYFSSSSTDPFYGSAVRAYVNTSGYWTTSDRNKKQDLNLIDNPIEAIKNINGYSFTFKINEVERQKGQIPEKSYGVIAQELEQVLPYAVQTNGAGDKYVNYSSIIPLLIEGIKSQQDMLDEQKSRIDRLEAKLRKYETLLEGNQ